MAAKKPKKQLICCPHCGHRQTEPITAYSTVCKSCRRHLRLADLAGGSGLQQPAPSLRPITCFSCGAALTVPTSAQSSMCKHCSSHIDLADYQITNTVSKNFRTKGRFVIEESGYVLNTDTIASDVVLKGRIIGRIQAENSLEIHTTAEIKGSFATEHLIIPPGQRFWWPELITAPVTEVAGELAANLQARKGVILRATARFFGKVQAPKLIIESGAVFVGHAQVGVLPEAAVAAGGATDGGMAEKRRKGR